jgi:crotonobetainyl-CoA:carnitine CoA-transferase CaiB-like acyl-CoA transferase
MQTGRPMLEGIRIIDLTSVVFGPYATQTLADLGAEVIKVEPPTGDTFRYSLKPGKTRAMSPGHMTLNRGKKSVALDLKNPDDAAKLKALIPTGDVFIHNIRADAIARLGFDFQSVKAINPDIIYVHCVGFGSGGPYAGLQAYDDVIQAATGTTSLQSRVDGDPAPRFIPSLVADKVAGLTAVWAVMAAIIHRLRTGEGQHVEVPMFEAFASFSLKDHLAGAMYDPPNAPIGYHRQFDPHRQPFPTKDGHIALVPNTDQGWFVVFGILGDSSILEREEMSTPIGRVRNTPALHAEIARLTPAKTNAEWVEAFRKAEIPCMPARDLADVLNDPHLNAVGFFERREHPTEGNLVEMRHPVSFGAYPTPVPPFAPLIGADTDTVLGKGSGGPA